MNDILRLDRKSKLKILGLKDFLNSLIRYFH